MVRTALYCLLVGLLALLPWRVAAEAPTRSTGPVLQAHGAVFDGVEPSWRPHASAYRAVFDVWIGPEAKDVPNPRLDTLARFLNMHARDGVPAQAMHLAVVLHGSAGKAVLDDDAYTERFGVPNPDRALLEALAGHGVRILVCGQSAKARGYAPEEMLPPVRIAMSALTAIMGLQAEGYAMMPNWE